VASGGAGGSVSSAGGCPGGGSCGSGVVSAVGDGAPQVAANSKIDVKASATANLAIHPLFRDVPPTWLLRVCLLFMIFSPLSIFHIVNHFPTWRLFSIEICPWQTLSQTFLRLTAPLIDAQSIASNTCRSSFAQIRHLLHRSSSTNIMGAGQNLDEVERPSMAIRVDQVGGATSSGASAARIRAAPNSDDRQLRGILQLERHHETLNEYARLNAMQGMAYNQIGLLITLDQK
jgi:hypothetical protein